MYIQNHIFTKEELAAKPLEKGEYEQCKFESGDWMNGSLMGYQFASCTFLHCNMSMLDLRDTAFDKVVFDQCKLVGARFDMCRDFGLSFRFVNCVLNYASFNRKVIRKTVFTGCQLQGVDFMETDLTQAVFNDCDFSGAQFDRTILEKADLSTSRNIVLLPENNKIKKAKFSRDNIEGLLAKYDLEIV